MRLSIVKVVRKKRDLEELSHYFEYNRTMYKLSKVVLIFDTKVDNQNLYERALESSEFTTIYAHNEEEFIDKCKETIPNVVVLNGTQEEVSYSKLIKTLRNNSLLRNSGLILLVDKIGHATTHKAKQLKVEIEEFPLKNHHFLQSIKKHSTKLVLPEINFEIKPELKVVSHVEFSEFNQIECQFLGPIKLMKGSKLNLKGELFNKLSICEENYVAAATGVAVEGQGYLNRIHLKGLSFDNLKIINDYKNGKVI